MEGEDLVQADHGQDPQRVGGYGGQGDLGAGGEGDLAGGEKGRDATGVAELQTAQADDQRPAGPQREAFDLSAQQVGVVVVEVAGYVQDVSGGGGAFGDVQRAHQW
ncbi:hypothetical protein GCM10020295_76800 [Streptomyces cinereospinus]